MRRRFLAELERLVGNPQSYRYLLAVSGGADSSVTALLFHQAGLPFAMAHCNFHLRGDDSNRDMELVHTLAEQFHAPLLVKEFDTLQLQKDSGLSIEMMARKLRYDWFEEIGADYDFIVTAHNANDAAETMLLNLCRGTGLKGMVSIPERNGKVLRPMLVFSAREIRHFAHENHLPFAVDSTNSDVSIPRNRIRNEVLPTLEHLNPSLIDTFSRNRAIFQKQYLFYQKHIEQCKKEAVFCRNNEVAIKKAFFAENPDKSVILYEILSDYGFPFFVTEKLLEDIPTGRYFLSHTHVLAVDRDLYIIQPLGEKKLPEMQFSNIDDLKQHFGVEKLQWTPQTSFPKDNHVLFIPVEKLHFPLTLRTWRDGDAFRPLGAPGRQKLSDYFSDHKIDRFAKHRIQLLCHGDAILWIVGHRSNEDYKVDSKTTDYYKITDYGTL